MGCSVFAPEYCYAVLERGLRYPDLKRTSGSGAITRFPADANRPFRHFEIVDSSSSDGTFELVTVGGFPSRVILSKDMYVTARMFLAEGSAIGRHSEQAGKAPAQGSAEVGDV